MNLQSTDIYAVKVWYGNALDQENITQDDFINIQDMIENLSPDTHENLQRPQSLPAHTDTGMFLQDINSMNKIKRLFQEACITLHEERYPQFKDRLKVYDSVARGFVLNHNTTVNETMSNHPWTYTGVLVCRTPENLPNGQGDLVFIDPLPTSDYNDKHGISSKELGTMAIFPGWLKYRLSPIRKEQGTYDTVMLLVMNAMIVHTQNEEHLQKEIEDIKKRSFETSKPMIAPNDSNKDDVFQLDPISQDKGEIEIGEYTTRPVPGKDVDNDKDIDIGSQ